jgi:hypothetical protein
MYDNTNTGMLMRNRNRETEKHPEFTGSINVDGVDYWLSAWVNTGKEGSKIEGQKYFSLKIKPKDGAKPKAPPKAQNLDDLEDDYPF